MYFKLPGHDDTVYYIPEGATPVDCPEDVEVEIVEVQNCAGDPGVCCSGRVFPCCVSTLSWVKYAKPAWLDMTGWNLDMFDAWSEMSNDLLPVSDYENSTFDGSCAIAFYARVGRPWIGDDGNTYRFRVWMDDNEFTGAIDRRDFWYTDPDTGEDVYIWNLDVGSIFRTQTHSQEPPERTCCKIKFYDIVNPDNPPIIADLWHNGCCKSTLTLEADSYDAAHPYAAGDIVIAPEVDGKLKVWVSVQNDNTGHTPATSGTAWWYAAYDWPCGSFGECPSGDNCEDIVFGGVNPGG
jgi:hypothetical protein